jgi:hypothetical protein
MNEAALSQHPCVCLNCGIFAVALPKLSSVTVNKCLVHLLRGGAPLNGHHLCNPGMVKPNADKVCSGIEPRSVPLNICSGILN